MAPEGSTADVLIAVRELSIGYGREPLLEHLSFDVLRGENFVILGPSGCGKTTLMRHLIGLEQRMGGTIEMALPASRQESAPSFGVTFQGGALFSSLTLLENVAVPLRQWTKLSPAAIDAIAAARLRLVGLDGFEGHLPDEISGGMRKRASIARALALDPPLLFLDEPSAGLDPITAAELDELVLTLRDRLGVTTVLVTHELESIFRVGDRCIMLDGDAKGIVAAGDPRELRDHHEDPRVHAFFNRQPRTR